MNLDLIKKLREETGVSISKCKEALEECKGDLEKAKKHLSKHGEKLASAKADRSTEKGLVECYVHPDGRIGVLVEINCETDFVARSDDFKELIHDVAMQIAATDPKDVKTLLEEEFIKDPSKKIKDLLVEKIGKLGENIQIKRFHRYELGKNKDKKED